MGLVEGKVAIVTGAGANIGEACARMLAAQGANVILADINLAGAERVAEDISASGGTAMACGVDLGDEDSIIALVSTTMERFGRKPVLARESHWNGFGGGRHRLRKTLPSRVLVIGCGPCPTPLF